MHFGLEERLDLHTSSFPNLNRMEGVSWYRTINTMSLSISSFDPLNRSLAIAIHHHDLMEPSGSEAVCQGGTAGEGYWLHALPADLLEASAWPP